jgi:hypothetical protein
MASPEAEDPELDFTNFMEKQKAALKASSAEKKEQPEEKKPMSPVLVRGIIFFAILLFLMGVLIVLYINRPDTGKIVAPEGYRILDNPKVPPKLEKIQ